MHTFSGLGRIVAILPASLIGMSPLSVMPASAVAATIHPVLRLKAPNVISFADRRVTITGELRTRDGGGIANEPVSVKLSGPDSRTMTVDLGTATTGADGSFALPATVPGAGRIQATFLGDGTYGRASGFGGIEVAAQLPTRIQMDPPPTTVEPDTDFAFTGTVEVRTHDQVWEPAGWATVWRTSGDQRAYTDKNGRFSFVARESVPAQWTFMTSETPQSFTSMALTDDYVVDVTPEQSRVASMKVRSNGVAQKGLTVTVHSDLKVGSQWKPYDGPLTLSFRRKGSKTWQRVDTDPKDKTVNAAGDQVFSHVIAPPREIPLPDGNATYLSQDGSWRADIPEVTSTIGRPAIKPTTGPAVRSVRQRYATGFLNRNIVPEDRGVVFTSYLWERYFAADGSGGYQGVVPHQRVKLYERIPGKKTWHYVRTVKSDAEGTIRATVPFDKTRYYRFVYAGSDVYAGAKSASGYYAA